MMLFDAVKLLLSIMTLVSMVLLSYSLFRISIRHHWGNALIIGSTVGIAHHLMKFVIGTQYSITLSVLLFIVLLKLVHGFPWLYAYAVAGIGFLVASTAEIIYTVIGIMTEFSSMQLMYQSIFHYFLFHSINIITLILLISLLLKFKIGFLFKISRFHAYDLSWLIVLTTGLAGLQYIGFLLKFLQLEWMALVLLVVVVTLSTAFAYASNKKMILSRYAVDFNH